MADPIDPIRKIGSALQQTARDIGLEMQTFVLIPDMTSDGASHIVQAMFVINDETPESESPEEDAEVAKLLQDIEDHERQASEDAALEAARERALGLSERLEGGGSFLDD